MITNHLTAVALITGAVIATLVTPAHSQECLIEQTSSRTGTTISLDLQSGCTTEARESFSAATLYWADFLYSPVTISVVGNFKPLSCSATSATLGSAGPTTAHENFTNAPDTNVYYPQALANSISRTDLSPANSDISMNYNNAIGTAGCLESSNGWYFDDGSSASVPAGYVDLYGVIQHELGHGLGFLSLYGSDGAALNGRTDSYSQHLYSETAGQYITSLSTASVGSAFISNGNLTWGGAAVDALSGTLSAGTTNSNVRMYAPNPYQSGSSVSHFDTALEPGELMEPMKLPREETNFPLTKNLFRDIGWITLPDPPALSASSVTADSITVSITPPAQSGGATILNYTVSCGTQSTTSSGSTATVTGLQAGTQYSCSAVTTTAIGTSDPSAVLVQSTSQPSTGGACTIERKSDRTGTIISIDLQTGCTTEAEETFGAAALFWADFLASLVEITVQGNFQALTCDKNSAVLGSAGPYNAYSNFAGAPESNVFYAVALRNSLNGADIEPSNPDIVMQYNNAIGTEGCLESVLGWYLDDGTATSIPAGYIDLYGTIQHELGHGLGFLSYYSSSGAFPQAFYSDSYSQYLYDEVLGSLVDTPLSDSDRAQAFISQGNLTWSGAAVDEESGTLAAGKTNGRVRMYAPNPYAAGSSVSHFDTAVEPSELMEPIKVARQLTNFHLTKNVMRDIGWITLPDAPSISLASRTESSLGFSLSPPKLDGGRTILNHTIECGSEGGAPKTATSASTSIQVTGLSQGVEYECTGFTTTAAGTSDGGNIITQRTDDAPVAFIASVKTGDEELIFTIGITYEHSLPILEYSVTCSDGENTKVGTSATSTVTVTGLENDVAYSCSATATNALGVGPSSPLTNGLMTEFSGGGLPIWLLYQATQ